MRALFAITSLLAGCHVELIPATEPDAQVVTPDAPHCDLTSSITGSAYGHTFGTLVHAGFTPEVFMPDAGQVHPMVISIDDGTTMLSIHGFHGAYTGTLTDTAGLNETMAKADGSGFLSDGCYSVGFTADFADGGRISGTFTPPRN